MSVEIIQAEIVENQLINKTLQNKMKTNMQHGGSNMHKHTLKGIICRICQFRCFVNGLGLASYERERDREGERETCPHLCTTLREDAALPNFVRMQNFILSTVASLLYPKLSRHTELLLFLHPLHRDREQSGAEERNGQSSVTRSLC